MDRDSAAVKGLVGGEDQGSSQEREEGQDVTHVSQEKHVGPVEQLITEDGLTICLPEMEILVIQTC